MNELGERIAKVETRQDIADIRLKAHGDQIDELMKQNVKQDDKLNSIDRKLSESCTITRSIKGGMDTIKWMIAGVSSVGGVWLLLKQLGIM